MQLADIQPSALGFLYVAKTDEVSYYILFVQLDRRLSCLNTLKVAGSRPVKH